ncbi:MAG: sel1 repeat family protein [Rhodocyclaceae bacterium]|nr:sel1 repeat family protein [Rhodocyclaceae bacterium]
MKTAALALVVFAGALLATSAMAGADAAGKLAAARRLEAAGQGRQAIAQLLPMARRGDAEAAYRLGRLYYYGEAGVPRDWRTSARWFARAAQAGHAGGQYKLGGMYYAGRGVRADLGKAIDWWAKAASQGHAESLNNLGALISTGTGLPADADLGLALQLVAAEKGSEAAAENVGNKPTSEEAQALAHQFMTDPAALARRLARLIFMMRGNAPAS